MPHSWKDLAYFIAVTVVLRYVILGLIADWLRGLLKHWLIKTERDLIIWTHYEKHGRHQNHTPKRPLDCQDERCREILA